MALHQVLREGNRGQCVLVVGMMIRGRCQERSGALGPITWARIMMEAEAAGGLHEDLNVPGREKETMGSYKAKMCWECSYREGNPQIALNI